MKDMLFITSQKNWRRGDWIEMVGKVFEIMPHKFGPFRQWTEPNLGHVSFMNKAKNIRVYLSSDMHFLGGTSIRIFVQYPDDRPSVGTTLEFEGAEDFKRMPANIVETVYDMIDHPENYGDQGFDNDEPDPEPEYDPDPADYAPVGSPVYAGWKWNYKMASEDGWFRCPDAPVRSFGGLIHSVTCAVEWRFLDRKTPTGEYRGLIYDTNTGRRLWEGQVVASGTEAYDDAKKHRKQFMV